MTPRKLRADSAAAAVKVMLKAAMADIEVPAHVNLREGDMPFWRSVTRARTRDEWSPTDLVLAAQLARCLADIEREQQELDSEGVLVPGPKGTLVPNPRVGLLEQFARREQALMRTLRMGGRAAGRSADHQQHRQLERIARRVRAEGDDLLA